MNLFIFDALANSEWAQALELLKLTLAEKERDPILMAYTEVVHALTDRGAPDVLTAAAEDLLWGDSGLSHLAMTGQTIPNGLKQAAHLDIEELYSFISRDWYSETVKAVSRSLPKLRELASPSKDVRITELAKMFQRNEPTLLEYLISTYQQHGTGNLSQFEAFRWTNGELRGVAHPVQVEMERLVALERPLSLLKKNTLAFLSKKPAQHVLLYGPRGSGKSTAIRSLLKKYSAASLRLIELSAKDLTSLPDVIEAVRFHPHRFIVFVDDLNFEQGDNAYQPLKTLLEGSLTERPNNVLVYATSNRRHLVKEQFSDRPDPLNDDVHAWDTHNERLALSDRFGLTITFPDATQQRYLEIVRGLVSKEHLTSDNLDDKAVRFAEWGNGYSGRTAQQFVDSLKADL
jgi:predicted AAA+ superfamily ATPase